MHTIRPIGLGVLFFTGLGSIFCGNGAGAEAVSAPTPGNVAPVAPEASATVAPAPVYGWKHEMTAQVGMAQTGFSNWSQGGEDSLAWQSSFLGKANEDEAGFSWNNTLKLGFGQVKSGGEEIKKSIDEINVETTYVYKLGIHVDPYISAKGISQFAAGYDYSGPVKVETSNFLDPGYFLESIGFGYTSGSLIKTRLGFALRETVAKVFFQYTDNSETAGIEYTRVEPGMESVTELNLKVSDILMFTSNLGLFSNLKAADQVVVRWDSQFNANLAKYISAGFKFQVFYDKTVSTQRQIFQALTLGLTYSYSTAGDSAAK